MSVSYKKICSFIFVIAIALISNGLLFPTFAEEDTGSLIEDAANSARNLAEKAAANAIIAQSAIYGATKANQLKEAQDALNNPNPNVDYSKSTNPYIRRLVLEGKLLANNGEKPRETFGKTGLIYSGEYSIGDTNSESFDSSKVTEQQPILPKEQMTTAELSEDKLKIDSMTTSTAGANFIGSWEGYDPNCYLCPAGVPTIGYGTAFSDASWCPMETVTQEQAVEMLKTELAEKEQCVKDRVKVPLTQAQFDMLVSLLYNIGCYGLDGDRILIDLNSGNYEAAAQDLLQYHHLLGGGDCQGLINRRNQEAEIFLNGYY